MSARLSFQGIAHQYDALLALRDFSLDVGAGEVVCLLGPSGCGKTTTLRIAAGVERPSYGTVAIDSRPVAGPGVFVPPEKRGVGLMFQDYALFPHLTVLDNVKFGLHQLPKDEREPIAMRALEGVNMARYARVHPHMLSGGEQQRVALARAMAPNPRIMLMDEPFSGLDNRLRDSVRDEALSLIDQSGASALLVTHDPQEAMRMADRIALMRKGQLVQLGTPQELYYRPVDVQAAAFFSDVNICGGTVSGGLVTCALGSFPAADFEDGTRVDVVLRPSAIDLHSAGIGVDATVRRARLLGEESLIEVEVGGHDALLQVRIRGTWLPAEGTHVKASADPERALLFEKATDA
ncbi:ATP-binding cassette domain-containing protein [Pyruvatibacter mobilis]|uniref:ATP-binding cassette domain-containing protein n=1 Tax=Pyruvatibacter mobilis TaxID=1712261 RepID=A0A845QBB8_9HYPH|nr:ABC transporter ATP-binding protein [Pyruvatibacter mobilis]NBG95955.1 ATP-binding cassette domain-containing protein [Pyruvatibacter mobilis]QJD75083.1 ABC transporter ATP-binding protein [Pyruvatibacter mobilis]GGD12602.1 iron ABC transporter ATP-binding protein [Pyruvatibacter mobilis]